jgi:hypothetical protein
VTADEFKAALPEFVGYDNPAIEAALSASAAYLSASDWGGFYTEGLINWVADRLVSRPVSPSDGAGAGDETMASVGSMMYQRDARIIRGEMANPYLRTVYGQRFLYVQGLAFGGTTLAGGGSPVITGSDLP